MCFVGVFFVCFFVLVVSGDCFVLIFVAFVVVFCLFVLFVFSKVPLCVAGCSSKQASCNNQTFGSRNGSMHPECLWPIKV